MVTIRWYLWEEDDGSSATFTPREGPLREMTEFGEAHTLVKTFDIKGCGEECWDRSKPGETVCKTCWITAMQAKNDHYGYGPYHWPKEWDEDAT